MAADHESVASGASVGSKKSIRDRVLCAVCSDAASGRYFGAIICEACKIFFIRSTRKGEPEFVCANGQRCEITPTTRLLCQACRFRKCIAVGMCRKAKTPKRPTPDQILCRVCGDVSSGIHFGVYTCEGCKGFFRRSSNSGDHVNYKCQGSKDCDITPTTRNLCRFCRYQKCLTEGMSRDKIQLGRHHKDGKDEKKVPPITYDREKNETASSLGTPSPKGDSENRFPTPSSQHSPPSRFVYHTAQYLPQWENPKEQIADVTEVSQDFEELEINSQESSNLSSPNMINGYQNQNQNHDSQGYESKYYNSPPSSEHLVSPQTQDNVSPFYDPIQTVPGPSDFSGLTGECNLVAIQKIIDAEDYTGIPVMNTPTSSPSLNTSGSAPTKQTYTMEMTSCPSTVSQDSCMPPSSNIKMTCQNEPKYSSSVPMHHPASSQHSSQYNTTYLVDLGSGLRFPPPSTCMMSSTVERHSNYHSPSSSNSHVYPVPLKEELYNPQRPECQVGVTNTLRTVRPNVIRCIHDQHQVKTEASSYPLEKPIYSYSPSSCDGVVSEMPDQLSQTSQEPYYSSTIESIPVISYEDIDHPVTKPNGIDSWSYNTTNPHDVKVDSVPYPPVPVRQQQDHITASNMCKTTSVSGASHRQNSMPSVFPELEPYAQDVKELDNSGMSQSHPNLAVKHQQNKHLKEHVQQNQERTGHWNYPDLEARMHPQKQDEGEDYSIGLDGFQAFWERVSKELADEKPTIQNSCDEKSKQHPSPVTCTSNDRNLISERPKLQAQSVHRSINNRYAGTERTILQASPPNRLPNDRNVAKERSSMHMGRDNKHVNNSRKNNSVKDEISVGGKGVQVYAVPIISYPTVCTKSMKREHPDPDEYDGEGCTTPMTVTPQQIRRHIREALNSMHQAMTAYCDSEEHSKASVEVSRSGRPVGSAWDKVKERVLCQDSSIIKFAKKVPGFRDLAICDQIVLIKHSAFAGQAPFLAYQENVYDWFVRTILDMESLKNIVSYFKTLLDRFVVDFRKLALRPEELGLYTAMIIANPNAPQLAGRESVTKLQQVIEDALKISIKENRGSLELYENLQKFLPDLSGMNAVLKNGFKSNASAANFDLPALSAELYY